MQLTPRNKFFKLTMQKGTLKECSELNLNLITVSLARKNDKDTKKLPSKLKPIEVIWCGLRFPPAATSNMKNLKNWALVS